jgi:hypothetical protein
MSTNKAKAEERYRAWLAKQSRRAPPLTEDAADLFPDEDEDDEDEDEDEDEEDEDEEDEDEDEEDEDEEDEEDEDEEDEEDEDEEDDARSATASRELANIRPTIDAFDESKIKRAPDGRFGDKAGAKKPAKKAATKKPAKKAATTKKTPKKKAATKKAPKKATAKKAPAKKGPSAAEKKKAAEEKKRATKEKKAAKQAEKERKIRHDPKTYKAQYKHLGKAAPQAAHGHAMKERGLDMHPDAVGDALRHLGSGEHGNPMIREGLADLDAFAKSHPEAKTIRELEAIAPDASSAFRSLSAMAAHADEMGAAGRMAPKLSVSKNTAGDPGAMGMVKRASTFYATFAHKDHTFNDLNVTFDPDRIRAAYAPKSNRVYHSGSKQRNPAVLEHEMGHCLEDQNPDVKAAALAFFEARTKGEETQSLKKKGKKDAAFYGKEEVCKPDKFLREYMGKVYRDGGTEILSMGLEYMAREPHTLYAHDPEMFHFLLGAMRGKTTKPRAPKKEAK